MASKRRRRSITDVERHTRLRRISRIAGQLGFVGRTEYRHVRSQTGGAQYCVGPSEHHDLLIVFAEAFERDADPKDFSLEAIIAHERGHQLLARHRRIARVVAGRMTPESEEILASLIGAFISASEKDRDALIAKSVVELIEYGAPAEIAIHRIQELWLLLEKLL